MTEGDEHLPEGEVDDLITAIVYRTRHHKDIVRGASVRGAIAFKEVLQGIMEIRGELTKSGVEKAALITLPSRISTKQGDYESAVAIVSAIIKEVLYDLQFSKSIIETTLFNKTDRLSPEDGATGLKSLNSVRSSQDQKQKLAQKGQATIIPDVDSHQGLSQHTQDKDFSQNQNPFKRTIENLMEELEQKLRRGEITEEEYDLEKGRLEEMQITALQPRYRTSSKELSDTLMELMDAQDEQLQEAINFEQIYIYYNVKLMNEGKQLSPQKRSYHELKALVNDMEKQGILRTVMPREGFALTAEAIDMLLEHLMLKARRGMELKNMIDSSKTSISERTHDIRRYSLGDAFRDLSVRHTLREIAKQRKELSGINRHDFRVFVKQHPRLQSDIILCVDTSGSMRYRRKLAYARLAAAGLARTALENGDRVGIVTFDNFGKAIMPLSNKREKVIDYIIGITAMGNTNIGDGIKCAAELLLREPNRNQRYIVLITDGQPTAISKKAFDRLKPEGKKDLTEEHGIIEAGRATSNGVNLSVVHITDGEEANEGFVEKIAKIGKGQVLRINCLDDPTIIR